MPSKSATKKRVRQVGLYKSKKKTKEARAKVWALKKSPVPTKFATKMRYATNFNLASVGGGVNAVQRFRANGLFDPDITGVGHQPRGFDQLMVLYGAYTVVGAKIMVMISCDTAVTDPFVAFIALRDNATQDSTNDYIEGGYVTWTSHSGSPNTAPLLLEYQVNPAKFLGRTSALSDPDLKGSSSGDPLEQVSFHVGLEAMDRSTATQSLKCQAVIEYSVILTEPNVPDQS